MTEWVISYEDSGKNQVNLALRELEEIEWNYKKQTKNVAEGDVAFLYEKAPIKAIRWKCSITTINCECSAVSAKYFKEDDAGDRVFRIAPLYEYPASSELSLESFRGIGYNGNMQGPFRLFTVPKLEKYIHTVDRAYRSGKKIPIIPLGIPTNILEKLAADRSATVPERYTITEKRYVRNPYVAALAKRRANGRCALCGGNAPFLDQYGQPFLEVHHIKPLADGGTDDGKNTIALCPNCHRKMHSLNDPQDIAVLTAQAGKE